MLLGLGLGFGALGLSSFTASGFRSLGGEAGGGESQSELESEPYNRNPIIGTRIGTLLSEP